MALQQLRVSNFGKSRANATTVGYTLLNSDGTTNTARTTAGVYESAPGIYAAYVSFPDNFRGQILWDTGAYFSQTYYASEQYNVEENDPRVADTYNMQFGRWKIESNQMIFYKADNITEIARFDLLDSSGNPTMDAVFDRFRV